MKLTVYYRNITGTLPVIKLTPNTDSKQINECCVVCEKQAATNQKQFSQLCVVGKDFD
jgi:hypothetical protein